MVVAVAHLTIAAIWLGSMSYSLIVVQPRVARFFADEGRREEFLTTLAQGNRWPVVGLIAALVLTAAALALGATGAASAGYAVVVVLYLGAAAVFYDVSWRHWPARVFALPEELPRFRRGLALRARTMLVLVAAAFLTALTMSLTADFTKGTG